MISFSLQPCRRLRATVFLGAAATSVIVGSYMYLSYIDTVTAEANYLTLGFQRVFVTSERPHMSRRHMMARLLGFHGVLFGFFPATRAYDIDHPETYTYWLGEEHWKPAPPNHTQSAAVLGEFRTHMNVINDILRLELSSALVLADSVDVAIDLVLSV
ncbi:hypothetical protein LPJ61_006231 [Coemansia biformis]|uniref:Uncharacterized protein n=1 Tax=Coemansia biformis TaxID=1286918 RepID=A0A9W7XX07_9FUNG|nr:hypothetical protein LPJ61_006231 [Coemansia biformis]